MIYPASYQDEKKIRTTAALGTVLFHIIIAVLISFLVVFKPKIPAVVELDWAGSSGAPNQCISESESEPDKSQESAQSGGEKEKNKIDVPEMKNPSSESIPDVSKEKPKVTTGKTQKKVKTEGSTVAPHRRAKAGIAGGAGKSTGYSIEWVGSGSRRLLSGRIPSYPEGTNKELPVTLQFSVLPDGSVTGIIPLLRSDELLEREAVQALQTWRFDPLPPQFEQKPQMGKITFKFVLQKE